jgi:hypothetical protein
MIVSKFLSPTALVLFRCAPLPRVAGDGTLDLIMPAVTLKAHYDGERILLDEPFEIPTNAPLMVTVLSSSVAERGEDWLSAARDSLARAYGDKEPTYTSGDVRR